MATHVSNDSPTFFYVVTLIFCIVLVIALGIAAYNYNTVSKLVLPADEAAASTTRKVRTSASAMMWVCIILALVALGVLIWAGYKLLTRKSVTSNVDINPAVYDSLKAGIPLATATTPLVPTAPAYVAAPTVATTGYVQPVPGLEELKRSEDITYLMSL